MQWYHWMAYIDSLKVDFCSYWKLLINHCHCCCCLDYEQKCYFVIRYFRVCMLQRYYSVNKIFKKWISTMQWLDLTASRIFGGTRNRPVASTVTSFPWFQISEGTYRNFNASKKVLKVVCTSEPSLFVRITGSYKVCCFFYYIIKKCHHVSDSFISSLRF